MRPEPQPASLFAFTNYNQPAIGDVGQSTAPDVYEPAMREDNPFTGGGKDTQPEDIKLAKELARQWESR